MNVRQLMKYFNVTERTVRRWNDNKCPHTKDSDGKCQYNIDDVEKWKKGQWTKGKDSK